MEDKIRAYSNLLTTINHEIRPPLNVICGFSEILQEEIETLSDEHKDMLISIERSAKEAISVFNDLIDASIITINENIKIRPEQVDLIQILKRTESHLNDEHWLAKYHHINFMIESKEQQINIEAEKSLLSYMFTWLFGEQALMGGNNNKTKNFLIPISANNDFVTISISNVIGQESTQIRELTEGGTYYNLVVKIIKAHSGTIAFKPDGNGKTFIEIILPVKQK
jgi:light-regulated signal transduction histidine kinase (bacteriophytochrome)